MFFLRKNYSVQSIKHSLNYFIQTLIAEELSKKTRNISIPATSYAEYKDSLDQDIIAGM